jgi:hypothetical protein
MASLSSEELSTLLIFQPINANWVREVHRFNSMRWSERHISIFIFRG